MFNLRYNVSDREWLNNISRLVELSTPEMRKFAKEQIRPFISRSVKHVLGVAPGSPGYPLDWQNQYQKIMFFITKGFGKGIPYQRTDEMINSWQTRGSYTERQFRISVSNDDPKAYWVVGEGQQDFHTKTGWPYAPDEIGYIFDDAWDMMVNHSDDLVDRTLRLE